MEISESTISHLLLFPSLSQWKFTVCPLYYSSMTLPLIRCNINSKCVKHGASAGAKLPTLIQSINNPQMMFLSPHQMKLFTLLGL